MKPGSAARNLGVVLLAGALASPAQAAINETHVYGIANFGHSGECGTDPTKTHSVHTETAAAFAVGFTFLRTLGLWDDVQTRNNTSAQGTYWSDYSKGGDCNCA